MLAARRARRRPTQVHARCGSRRGGMAVVLALMLVILMGFAALVIDLGHARLVRGQLQAAADASAMAGAQLLDGTDEGLSSARETAVAVAGEHAARGQVIVIEENSANDPEGAVVLGIWEDDTFTPSIDSSIVNAVRVNLSDTDIGAIFSEPAFGSGPLSAEVRATALARPGLGAGGVDWYWPFGMADCMFEEYSDTKIESLTLKLVPDGKDTTGWTAIGATPSASWGKSHTSLAADCMAQWYTTGSTDESCTSSDVGEVANTSNGAVDAGLQELDGLLESSPMTWDTSRWGTMPAQVETSSIASAKYGRVLEGPFPVIDTTSDYCTTGGTWNKSFEVLGFVWGVIYDLNWKGASDTKNIYIKLDVTEIYDVGNSWGGGDYGVVKSAPPSLVE